MVVNFNEEFYLVFIKIATIVCCGYDNSCLNTSF